MQETEFINITSTKTRFPVHYKVTYKNISSNKSDKTSTFRLTGYLVLEGTSYTTTDSEIKINNDIITSGKLEVSGTGEHFLGYTDITIAHDSTTGKMPSTDISASINRTYGFNNQQKNGTIPSSAAPTYVYIAKNSPPTAVKVSPTMIGTTGGRITINWSGATAGSGNSISSYAIWINYNNERWRKIKTVNSNSISTTYDIGSSDSGSSYAIRVEANSDTSGYSSGMGNAQAILNINNLPNSPSFSSPIIISSSGGNINIPVTPGASNDSGQQLSIYYSEIDNDTNKILAKNNTISTNIIWASNEIQRQYNVWTYDGYDYSKPAILMINRNSIPMIKKVVNEYNTPDKPYILKNATATANETNLTYKWYYQINNNTEDKEIQGYSENTISNINLKKLEGVNSGDTIKIGARAIDSYGDKSKIIYGTEQTTIPIGELSYNGTFEVYSILASGEENNSYYDSEVYFRYNAEDATSSFGEIKYNIYYRLLQSGSGNNEIYGERYKVNYSSTTNSFLATNIARGIKVKFELVFSDDIEELVIEDTINRITLPKYNGNLKINPTNIKPYSDLPENNVTFSFFKTESNYISPVDYKYYIVYTNIDVSEEIELIEPFTPTSEEISSGSTYQKNISISKIKESFENTYRETSELPLNKNYNTNFSIYVKDIFGNESSRSSALLSVNFQESPKWANGISNFTLYKQIGGTLTEILDTEVYNSTKRMINANMPGFYFKMPPRLDENNDISGYELSMTIKDTNGNTSPIFNPTIDNYQIIQKGEVNNTTLYIQYIPQNINEPKFAKFRLRLYDSTGLYSESLYSNTYIILCRNNGIDLRVQDIIVSDAQCTVYYNIIDTGTNLDENFDNLNSYKNAVPDDATTTGRFIYFILSKNSEGIAGTSIEISSEVPVSKYVSKGKHFITFPIDSSSIKNRDKLTFEINVSTDVNSNDYKGSYQNYTYYINAPTVSKRAHRIGINTNDFTSLVDTNIDSEVLIVRSFNQYKIVKLIDDSDQQNIKTITINLSNGEIDGAIINGGEW